MDETRVVSATAVVDAPAEVIFGWIADPARQVEWDGNDNLAAAAEGQRVHAVGDSFVMTLTRDGAQRRNRIVDFEEGRRIAWRPAPLDGDEPGHEWRWELRPLEGGRTEVTHIYDWRELTDERRLARARRTTSERLRASVDRLAEVVTAAG